MYRRSLVVVLTAVLVASALLVLTPNVGHASPASTAASHLGASSQPAAGLAYDILNGYGYSTDSFYPGDTGYGILYFTIYDAVDHTVTVTISNPNVATPVFRYVATMNTTTNSYDSYVSGVSYTFPTNLVYGGTWDVNFSGTNAGTATQAITLHLYYTSISTSVGTYPTSTLPGQPVTLYWNLYSVANGVSPYTHATKVTLTGTYVTSAGTQSIFPTGSVSLTPVDTGYGEWNGTVPDNAVADSAMSFEIYAVTNVSGHVVENESAPADVYIGSLYVSAYLMTAPPTCDYSQDVFPAGTLIAACVTAGSYYADSLTPIAGLPITVVYWNGTARVHPTGGAPSSLTTNAVGQVAFTFNGTSPPFVGEFKYPRYNAVNATVTDPVGTPTSSWTTWWNQTFYLNGRSTASGIVQVSLDKTSYYVGNTATATWAISTSNLTLTGPVTPVAWQVWTWDYTKLLGQGPLNSTASTGTIAIPVTQSMVAADQLEVEVIAANSTAGFYGYAFAYVVTPDLLLSPNTGYYNAGSTASVTATLNGGGAGATIEYIVTAYWSSAGAPVATGTVANGSSISVSVPSSNPPLEYEFDAWATVSGQVIATASTFVDLAYGYAVVLGVSTASSYSDGSYQPGQTVTLTYDVVSYGGAPLPQVFSFELYASGYPYYQLIQNVGPSGSISYTIPSSAVRGTLSIELEVGGALQHCLTYTYAYGCSGVVTLLINPSPSVLSLELMAGSGLTVGWLILLILLIVVAVILAVLIARRGGRRPSASTMNPPASAPSTAAPAEWKEPPAQSGDSASSQPPTGAQ